MTRWQANTLLLLVALIWGSAFVAQNLAMAHMGPMGFTGVRFLVGALVVAPLAWREWKYLRGRGLHHSREDLVPVVGLGLLLCLGAGLQQVGIQSTTVTNAGFLTALYVPLVPLLAWWRSGRAPQFWLWPASAGCVLGTYLLSGAGSMAFNQGDLWVLASVLPWALHILFVGEVAKRMSAPFLVACGQFLACGVAGLAWGLVTEPFSLSAVAAAAPAIAFTGIVSVGIGFTGQVIAQSNTTPGDAAILLSTETLFAALFGYALMGDRLSATAWAGAALIFAGMLAVQLLALRQPARQAGPASPAQNE
jgi:drug/metabolite transporter (DMT)-like permease